MESCRPLLAAVWWNTTNRYRNSTSKWTRERHVACLYDVVILSELPQYESRRIGVTTSPFLCASLMTTCRWIWILDAHFSVIC